MCDPAHIRSLDLSVIETGKVEGTRGGMDAVLLFSGARAAVGDDENSDGDDCGYSSTTI